MYIPLKKKNKYTYIIYCNNVVVNCKAKRCKAASISVPLRELQGISYQNDRIHASVSFAYASLEIIFLMEFCDKITLVNLVYFHCCYKPSLPVVPTVEDFVVAIKSSSFFSIPLNTYFMLSSLYFHCARRSFVMALHIWVHTDNFKIVNSNL